MFLKLYFISWFLEPRGWTRNLGWAPGRSDQGPFRLSGDYPPPRPLDTNQGGTNYLETKIDITDVGNDPVLVLIATGLRDLHWVGDRS